MFLKWCIKSYVFWKKKCKHVCCCYFSASFCLMQEQWLDSGTIAGEWYYCLSRHTCLTHFQLSFWRCWSCLPACHVTFCSLSVGSRLLGVESFSNLQIQIYQYMLLFLASVTKHHHLTCSSSKA